MIKWQLFFHLISKFNKKINEKYSTWYNLHLSIVYWIKWLDVFCYPEKEQILIILKPIVHFKNIGTKNRKIGININWLEEKTGMRKNQEPRKRLITVIEITSICLDVGGSGDCLGREGARDLFCVWCKS